MLKAATVQIRRFKIVNIHDDVAVYYLLMLTPELCTDMLATNSRSATTKWSKLVVVTVNKQLLK